MSAYSNFYLPPLNSYVLLNSPAFYVETYDDVQSYKFTYQVHALSTALQLPPTQSLMCRVISNPANRTLKLQSSSSTMVLDQLIIV